MKSQPKVLAVDADSEVLIGLEHALENAGIETTTTWNVSEALALLESGQYEVLLLRKHPDMDVSGMEVRSAHGRRYRTLNVDNLRDHNRIIQLLSERRSAERGSRAS